MNMSLTWHGPKRETVLNVFAAAIQCPADFLHDTFCRALHKPLTHCDSIQGCGLLSLLRLQSLLSHSLSHGFDTCFDHPWPEILSDLSGYGFHTAASLSPTLDSHWWRRNFWLRECPSNKSPLGLFEAPHCWWTFKAGTLVSGPPAANIFHCSARRSDVPRSYDLQCNLHPRHHPCSSSNLQAKRCHPKDVSSCEVFWTLSCENISFCCKELSSESASASSRQVWSVEVTMLSSYRLSACANDSSQQLRENLITWECTGDSGNMIQEI